MKLILKAALVGIPVFFIDLFSKLWVHTVHPTTVPIDFFGIAFSITHAINKGAAWGILSHFQIPLLLLRIALTVGLLLFLIRYNHRPSWETPLLLIAMGALGNICDYFFYGHVIDMFHFVFWGYDYPVFNVADSAIFIGVLWIAATSSLSRSSLPNENGN